MPATHLNMATQQTACVTLLVVGAISCTPEGLMWDQALRASEVWQLSSSPEVHTLVDDLLHGDTAARRQAANALGPISMQPQEYEEGWRMACGSSLLFPSLDEPFAAFPLQQNPSRDDSYKAFTALLLGLADEDPAVVALTARSLSCPPRPRLEVEQTIVALKPLLQGDCLQRAVGAYMIERLLLKRNEDTPALDDETLQALAGLLWDESCHPIERGTAKRALGVLPEALPWLEDGLAQPGTARLWSAWTLGNHVWIADAFLSDCASWNASEDCYRQRASRIDQVFEILRGLLTDSEPRMRLVAVAAVKQACSGGFFQPLEDRIRCINRMGLPKLAAQDPEPLVRHVAQRELKESAGLGFPESLNCVVRFLEGQKFHTVNLRKTMSADPLECPPNRSRPSSDT